ncbi:16555_t:CDS:2, partial [Funneliformis geosporum]
GITSVNHPNAINNDAKDLWKGLTYDYQEHVTISPNGSSDRIDDTNETDIRKKIFIEDLRTRKDWKRDGDKMVALKSLKDSRDISKQFLNEIKSHLQIYIYYVIQCFGITQDPITKNYMMVLRYCENGSLHKFISKHENIAYENKINDLSYMAKGLNDIHNAGKIHKDLHPGNILLTAYITPYISDLGMCQPVNQPSIKEGIYGVLPYIDPEVLRGHQYTKSSDIYSLGIIMNEYFSEELPYANKSHDIYLAIEICGGQRPKISEDTPKPLANLIKRCWDPRVENRPTAKQLYQTLHKLDIERHQTNSDINIQMQEYVRVR